MGDEYQAVQAGSKEGFLGVFVILMCLGGVGFPVIGDICFYWRGPLLTEQLLLLKILLLFFILVPWAFLIEAVSWLHSFGV